MDFVPFYHLARERPINLSIMIATVADANHTIAPMIIPVLNDIVKPTLKRNDMNKDKHQKQDRVLPIILLGQNQVSVSVESFC